MCSWFCLIHYHKTKRMCKTKLAKLPIKIRENGTTRWHRSLTSFTTILTSILNFVRIPRSMYICCRRTNISGSSHCQLSNVGFRKYCRTSSVICTWLKKKLNILVTYIRGYKHTESIYSIQLKDSRVLRKIPNKISSQNKSPTSEHT